MRIVHICVKSHVTDGLSYQENLLSKYHCRAGHEVTIITSRWQLNSSGYYGLADETEYVNECGIKVIRLSAFGRENYNDKFVRYKGFYQSMEEADPDLIFVHGVAYLDIKQVAKYAKNHKGIALYVDSYADFSNSATNWLSKSVLHEMVWRHYSGLLVPHARKFYGVTPARVDFLTDVYRIPKEKCELLVMGADDEMVEKYDGKSSRREIGAYYRIEEDDFLIVSGGKIDRWKYETIYLMEAVKRIENPKVKLVIFGSVADELRERFDALHDDKKVYYAGWIDSEISYKYFAAADLVVFPGRHSVFWEQAAGQGVPMICKDWDGTHHVDVGGNVRFIKSESADEIKGVIEKLLDRPDDLKNMKKAAVEGMKVFSYRDIARRCIEDD